MSYATDEEIRTALRVLNAFRDELKAHTKRRMDRIPDNVAWNEKATHIDFDLRGNLRARVMINQTRLASLEEPPPLPDQSIVARWEHSLLL
jgi:hypothetical protein